MGLINYIAKKLINVTVKNGSTLDRYFLSQIVSLPSTQIMMTAPLLIVIVITLTYSPLLIKL